MHKNTGLHVVFSRERICDDVLQMLASVDDNVQDELLPRARAMLRTIIVPQRVNTDAHGFPTCSNACALTQRSQPALLSRYTPVSIAGDGNCLFRAVSVALYGDETHHMHIRALAAMEVLGHSLWLDTTLPNCMHPLRDNPYIVLPDYPLLCTKICGLRRSCGVSTIVAISSITGVPIQTFWPPLAGSLETEPLTIRIVGRDVYNTTRGITVMWSSCGPVQGTGPVEINHFVPLLSAVANCKPESVIAVYNIPGSLGVAVILLSHLM